jgi:uncharacterized membrane protein
MPKKSFTILPKAFKSKYAWGDKVPASGIYECSICENLEAFQKGEHFSQCQDCINRHEKKDNSWFVTNEFTYFLSKNMNIEFDKFASLEVKLANKITTWAGSMVFVYIHILWFGLWVWANSGHFGPQYVFDPFPYGLLTMIVSLEAIFLATFIMISQNISSQKSELRAEHEYQINLETEKNVAEILAMVKDIKKAEEYKHDEIEDIKESIEDIVPSTHVEATISTEPDTPVPVEAIEKEHYEGHADILKSEGIDIIEESAPPVVLEEVKKKRGRKKKVVEENNG